MKEKAVIGVSDHNGWAVFVAVGAGAAILDRRRVVLVDSDLPCMPHHHEAQALPVAQGIELVERVRTSAEKHAVAALDAVATELKLSIVGLALRECPQLPPTIAERLQNYRAQNVADTVMYRMALADAAQARGWAVHWYDPREVFESASRALRVKNLEAYFRQAKADLGSPWNNDHKLAMAGAVTARGEWV